MRVHKYLETIESYSKQIRVTVYIQGKLMELRLTKDDIPNFMGLHVNYFCPRHWCQVLKQVLKKNY
jgi:hypothetical protein